MKIERMSYPLYRRLRENLLLGVIFVTCLLTLLPLPVRAQAVWDLADDWSDVDNPNGPWSYNGAFELPVTTHWDDWDAIDCCFSSDQPAWADTQLPSPGHVPTWFKTVADTTGGLDLPIGTVGMHGADSSSFAAGGAAGVSWRSTVSGIVEISGGVWLAKDQGRSMSWTLSINGLTLTAGGLETGDEFDSSNPQTFAGQLGQPVILVVDAGDLINLELFKTGGRSAYAEFVGVELTIATVGVQAVLDIKPGGFPNSINLNSEGVIPVAIITTSTLQGEALDFDATTVDVTSLLFGPNGAVEARGVRHLEDVDGDGDLDLILHFKTQDTGIQCSDTLASLTGQTLEGQFIEGVDSIRTVGCK